MSNEKKKQEKKKKDKPSAKPDKPAIQYTPSGLLKPLAELFQLPKSSNISNVLLLTFLIELALSAHVLNFAPVLWDVYKTPARWIGYTLGIQGLMIVLAMPRTDLISKLYTKDENFAQIILHGFIVFMLSAVCLYLTASWNGVIVCIVPLSISYALLKNATSELLRRRNASSSGSKMSTIARITAPLCTCFAYDIQGYLGTSLLKAAIAGVGIAISLSLAKPVSTDKKKK